MKLSHAVFAIVLMFVGGCASQARLNSFFFIQMADTQFGFFNENRDFQKETVNFEKAIAEANRLRPAFVIVCGDLVNKPGDTDQVAEYKRIASQLNPAIKLYNVAGNHDVENMPTKNSLAKYRTNFGKDYYSFQSGRLFGIVLNSSLMKEPDSSREEAQAQELWLRGTLKDAQTLNKKLIVVFQHHSLFLKDPDEKDEYFNFPSAQRNKYLALFKDYGVQYVFAGHYHRNAFGKAGSIDMITTGPVGRPLGNDPSGFRIVTVQGDNLYHQYHSLDSIPTSVDLK